MHYSRRCTRIELNNRICRSDNSQHYVVSQILERILIDLFTSFSCCFLNSNKQRLEKCVWCVLLLYNWDLPRVTTYPQNVHNLVLFKFIIKQLEARFRRRSTHVPNLTDELSPAKERRLNHIGKAVLIRCSNFVNFDKVCRIIRHWRLIRRSPHATNQMH